MEEAIIYFLLQHNYNYVKIGSTSGLIKIYNLLILNQFEEAMIDIEYLYFGVYYSILNQKNDTVNAYNELSINYYLKGVNENNAISICNLAKIYVKDKNINSTIKYYLMAVELNDAIAMNNLALLYEKQKDIDSAIKYYLMAIQHKCEIAVINLAYLYMKEKKFDIAKKYYLELFEDNIPMVMEESYHNGICNLGTIYLNENDIENVKKYYSIAIEHKNIITMINLVGLYETKLDFENTTHSDASHHRGIPHKNII